MTTPTPTKAGLPDYPESTWAADKSADEIYDEILRRREHKRATFGLLERGDMTLEMLYAERFQVSHRSPADKAGEPTPSEQKRLDAAEAAYHAADAAHRAALQAKYEVQRSVDNPSRELSAGRIEADRFLGKSYDVNPSEKPEKLRDWEDSLRRADRGVERTRKVLDEAQLRQNNVRANIGVRRQKRRVEVQGAINRAGFLDNLRQYGGQVTAEIKKAMDRAYGKAK